MKDQPKSRRKTKIGLVTSDKMDKTVVVRVGRKFRHTEYGKVISRFTKFKAHDEKNAAKVGDRVQIVETRPLSKQKSWRLESIITKAASDGEANLS